MQEFLADLDPELPRHYQRHNPFVHGTVVSQARAVSAVMVQDSPRLHVAYVDLTDSDAFPLYGEVVEITFTAMRCLHALGKLAPTEEALEAWGETLARLTDRLSTCCRKINEAFRREPRDPPPNCGD